MKQVFLAAAAAWATGDTAIQVTGIGPFDVTYVDP